jgi:hypothetical protein
MFSFDNYLAWLCLMYTDTLLQAVRITRGHIGPRVQIGLTDQPLEKPFECYPTAPFRDLNPIQLAGRPSICSHLWLMHPMSAHTNGPLKPLTLESVSRLVRSLWLMKQACEFYLISTVPHPVPFIWLLPYVCSLPSPQLGHSEPSRP